MGPATSGDDGEKSRNFFIPPSGDPGCEEPHTPAENISIETNDCIKVCDRRRLVVFPRRKNDSERMIAKTTFITTVGQAKETDVLSHAGNIKRIEPLTASISSYPRQFIPTKKPNCCRYR